MSRLSFMAAIVAALLSAVAALAQEKRPNILVIWGDDVGMTACPMAGG